MTDEVMENETPKNDEGEEQQPEADNESKEEMVEIDGKSMTKREAYEQQKIRAEMAESELKKLKAEANKAETEAKKSKENETPKNDEQSDEPDYARLAFLEGKGIKHPDDQKIVQDEATRLKLPLTDILGMEHIKSKLKDAKDQREAEKGMPEGSGKSSSGNKTSVEYWKNKKDKDGNYLNSGNLELDNKVIDARVKKEKSDNMFSEQLF